MLPIALLMLSLKLLQLTHLREMSNHAKRLWGMLLLSSVILATLAVDPRGAHRYAEVWYCRMLLQSNEVVILHCVMTNAIDQ